MPRIGGDGWNLFQNPASSGPVPDLNHHYGAIAAFGHRCSKSLRRLPVALIACHNESYRRAERRYLHALIFVQPIRLSCLLLSSHFGCSTVRLVRFCQERWLSIDFIGKTGSKSGSAPGRIRQPRPAMGTELGVGFQLAATAGAEPPLCLGDGRRCRAGAEQGGCFGGGSRGGVDAV
jgi:hypothetical protein